MTNAIQRRTQELYEERMARRKERNVFGSEIPRLKNRILTETSSMSSTSGMNSNIRNARLHGYNTNVGKGIWSLSSRIPPKPYMPILPDSYPRDPFTMMPRQQHAPKYYEGRFWNYDHKDSVQQAKEGDYHEGRHVIFKPENIEKVQTKKKYGQNLKGQSTVSLHLCNDVTSELFQRSLNPCGDRDRSHLTSSSSSRASEISELQAIVDKYPDVRLHKTKNQTSVLNPLGPALTTQRWIDTTYPTSSRRRHDAIATMDNERMRPRRYSVKSEPEWYSSMFPKQRVADAMKFMGQSEAVIHKSPGRRKEYDINFHGYK